MKCQFHFLKITLIYIQDSSYCGSTDAEILLYYFLNLLINTITGHLFFLLC